MILLLFSSEDLDLEAGAAAEAAAFAEQGEEKEHQARSHCVIQMTYFFSFVML